LGTRLMECKIAPVSRSVKPLNAPDVWRPTEGPPHTMRCASGHSLLDCRVPFFDALRPAHKDTHGV
jgi:hypothetical protein